MNIKIIKIVAFACCLIMSMVGYGQKSVIKMPAGRIAFSSDGNLHDSDDWGATALSLALIHYAGVGDRLVHYDYNNHIGNSRAAWEKIMDDASKGGAKRFNLDASKFFNDQTEKEAAVANFVKEANKSTPKNPLWFICAGPMQVAYDLLAATPKNKRPFIYAISHGKWNNEHQHGESAKTWADMKKDFPEVTYHQIHDQNTSNGEDDFHSHIQNWYWLRDSQNENWQWLYNLDDTNQVDRLEKWKSDTEKAFDVSDAGMTYWLLTGGPNGGNDKASWKEAKALFENKPKETKTTPSVELTNQDYIKIEAESTPSDLGLWQKIVPGNKNYVENASGEAYLEFTGNEPSKGDPTSPLQYTFTAPKDGNFRLLLMASKRLEGARGDLCNDVYLKMTGDYTSATTLTKEELGDYLKFFQEGSVKTPERAWHWGNRGEKGAHKFHNFIYNLKKGQSYTLTLAGRSQRFSADYLVLYDADKFSLRKAQETFKK